MGRIWWMAGLTTLVLALAGFAVAACGSGDEEPAPVQEQAQPEQPQEAQQAEPIGPQPAEAEEDDQADAPTTVAVSYHKGVAAERHVLGDPDAAIVILHFGDFQ